MLSEIYIQNLAVIEKAAIDFSMGLNIFTGETGAGKSIVVDSINAVLGQRVSREIVRTGCDKAVVVGVFTDLPAHVLNKISEYGYETDNGQLIVQREIHADGRGNARICGRPASISVVKDICSELVNIHGQHDNQALLSTEKHIHMLDEYGGYDDVLETYRSIFHELRDVVVEMKNLSADETQKEQRRDFLSYQIDEIVSADLQPDEDIQLEEDVKLMRNYSNIAESLNEAHQYLMGDEENNGAVDLLASASSAVNSIGESGEELESIATALQDIYYTLQEVSGRIGIFMEGFDFDPARLAAMEERLDEIRRLKKKYGGSLEEINRYLVSAQQELETLESADARLEELAQKRHELMQKAQQQGEVLSKCRAEAAKRFTASVTRELKFLDMPNVVLKVLLTPCKMNRLGRETVEFLISTNPGEPPKSISKIASGGELSRIMLAIKNCLADKDRIPTMIFDEVDTGVSGRAAQKIGLKLKEVAHNKQVLCVTHLAQIAAMADTHFLIKKDAQDGRTYTSVIPLDFEGRKHEVARIMGTGEMSDLLLQNAEQMILAGKG